MSAKEDLYLLKILGLFIYGVVMIPVIIVAAIAMWFKSLGEDGTDDTRTKKSS